MLFSNDKKWFFSLDRFKNLTVINNESKPVVLAPDITSFDVICASPEEAKVFFSTVLGSLVLGKYDGKTFSAQPLMTSKNSGRICSVKVVAINGRYHVFYCLDCQKRYLVHQVVSGDGFYEPVVVDNIGTRFIYSIIKDDDSDIHVVYEVEGLLKYKKYIYSEKRYTHSEVVCATKPQKLCISMREDRIFALFTEKGSGLCRLYVADVCDRAVKKAIMSVDNDSDISVNCKSSGITVHIAEGGVCYEVVCDYNLNAQKPRSIGRCGGIHRIRFCNEKTSVESYPVNRHMTPFDSYVSFERHSEDSMRFFAPKGKETEQFASRNMENFAHRITEIINEDLLLRLARIEASLAKLTECTEKTSEESKGTETPS